MTKRFNSFFEHLEQQDKRTRIALTLAGFFLLLFLVFAINAPIRGLVLNVFFQPAKALTQPVDATTSVERLGNPFYGKYPYDRYDRLGAFPRNVWDMTTYNGKIYLGSGDSAQNVGSVDLWTYDPPSGQFAIDYPAVPEEQIGKFVQLGDALYIPGHDHDFGTQDSYYKHDGTSWQEYYLFVQTAHMYDIASPSATEILLAGSDFNFNAVVWVSNDSGATWQKRTLDTYTFRTYALLPAGGKTFAITNPIGAGSPFYEYIASTSSFLRRPDLYFVTIFPNTSGVPKLDQGDVKVLKYLPFLDTTVYIGSTIENNHHGMPFGLYSAKTITSAEKITLPANTMPWDMEVNGNTLYVLLNEKLPDGTFKIHVLATTDLANWQELFFFTRETYARSFAFLNGDFYFGLGTGDEMFNTDDTATYLRLSRAAGDILRVKECVYTVNPCNSLPTPTASTGANLVTNDSFETLTSGYPTNWTTSPAVTLDTTVAHTGTNSLKITGGIATSAFPSQAVTLKPSTTYTMSMWIKPQSVPTTDFGITPRYTVTSATPTTYEQATHAKGTDVWLQMVKTFTTAANYQAGNLAPVFSLSSGATAWVDDVSICEGIGACTASPSGTPTPTPSGVVPPTNTPTPTQTPTPAPPTSTPTPTPPPPQPTPTPTPQSINLVGNPSFEVLSSGFPISWQRRNSLTVDTTITHTGQTSLKVIGGNGYTFAQNLPALKPSTTYTLSGWVKTQGVTTTTGLKLRYPITAGTVDNSVITNPGITGTTDWIRVQKTFTTAADYSAGRLDLLYNVNTGATAWFDDVSLCEGTQACL